MRAAVNAFLEHDTSGRAAFVPAMEPLAARVGGMDYQTMTRDPAHWSSSLAKAGQLLGADALVLGFDTTLIAEACGVHVQWEGDRPILTDLDEPSASGARINGRLGVAVEALNRLCQTVRTDFGCVAAMTGPFTLATQLFQDAAAERVAELKKITVEIAEALCSTRPDLLLFREGAAMGAGPVSMQQRRAFNTLCNVARYFDVPTGIYIEGYVHDILETIDKLKLDFYFLGETVDGTPPQPGRLIDLAQRVNGIGVALPFSNKTEAIRYAEQCTAALTGSNYLFTSLGELSQDTDLETVRSIVTRLKALG